MCCNFKECLQNLLNLKYLEIINDWSTFEGKCLSNLTNLTHLNINSTKVKDEYLGKLINLCYLDVCHCENITGEFLTKLSNLKHLNISETKVFENYLSNLHQLVTLEADDCRKIINGNFLLNLNLLQKFKYMYHDFTYEENNLLTLKTLLKAKRTLSQIAEMKESIEEESEEECEESDSD